HGPERGPLCPGARLLPLRDHVKRSCSDEKAAAYRRGRRGRRSTFEEACHALKQRLYPACEPRSHLLGRRCPMSMEMKQSLKQTMQMVMTPQLQMAIKLLQVSRMELVEQMNEEIKENPFLEDEIETDAEKLRDDRELPGQREEMIGETERPVETPLAKETD